ncbi:endonuclease MutS2 [Microcoleus sp. FACHB-831]|uniref:endonuclease MutS2 n=1 Tax=Microcoleus sp. FACHB-831 TaxID=2692827 RepID=UPI0016841AAA|nr:endonuclease MutS2 [Microcoleus sp. FACHB-831]MBD1923213.1 endonuclease MutS2 [Microcoleus sp. FACHB-831]
MIQSETLELLEWPRLCQHLATFAATKLGAIAARHLQIPTTQAESGNLLAQTQEVYNLESRQPNALTFEGIGDIGDSLERAELGGMLSGEELLAIATTLSGVRRLRRIIDDQTDMPVLTALVAEVRTYPELEQEIHRCIDERGDVADRASVKLAEIRIELRRLRDRIYSVLQGILQRKANAVGQQVITQRGDRFVIPVKAPQKDAIPGIVHDTSASGATLYIEPQAIVQLGNQLRQEQRREQAEVEAILSALTMQVAAVKPDLEQVLAVATTLDLATARARYSYWLEANPPRFINRNDRQQEEFTDSKIAQTITLRQLRHPLLVWQQKHEQGTAVVPVDLLIQPQIRVVTITGPNTGGKTVTLKTLGLAALMAKVGLFVAAREPVELPWFDLVLADIGDEQSLEQSLSTFSGHIRRISRVLDAIKTDESGELEVENNDENPQSSETNDRPSNPKSKIQNLKSSLVLLDEVGAGTDPAEGSALAIALLHYLADNATLSIATTHFGELKALKYEDERFENASVEFDDVSLSPTYRLLWGIPGRSNALAIARRLGLKPEIVEEAKTHVGEASEDVNQVIAGLEAQRRRQETKAQEAAKLLQQAEQLHQQVSRKANALQERERELKLSQERAVQDAIAQAKGEIASVIRRLQQGTATAGDAQSATNALNEIAQRNLPSRQQPAKPKPAFKPKEGDRVRLPNFGQTAEVLSVSEADGQLTVRFGLMKMTLPLTDIESLDGQKVEQPAKAKPAPPPAAVVQQQPAPVVRTSKNTLDIRGSRVADAEMELDRTIGKMSGEPLWIIHGKGTGQLRRGVHSFLEQHPQVERFDLAESADGGAGVTVVYIK